MDSLYFDYVYTTHLHSPISLSQTPSLSPWRGWLGNAMDLQGPSSLLCDNSLDVHIATSIEAGKRVANGVGIGATAAR